MKSIKLTLLLLLSTILYSCQGKENSFPGYEYRLNLKFTDNNGNDLVKGIPYESDPPYISEYYPVKKDQCILKSLTDRITISTPLININEPTQSLRIYLSSPPSDREFKPQTISFLLTSKYIFNDEVPRKIITTWEYGNYNIVCKNFTFENKEFPISYNNDTRFNHTVISLD